MPRHQSRPPIIKTQRVLLWLIALVQARRASEWIGLFPIHSLARRAWIGVPVFAVFGFHVAFCEPPNSPPVEKPPVATREPIPDDDAPQEFKRLIADGKVKVVYDSDPEFVKAGRGWADFNVLLKHSYKYNLTKSKKNGRWQVKLVIHKFEPKIELTHLIRLPVSFKSPKVWRSQILRHEFDHVAVSLDPRAILLLRHLLAHLPVIERTLEPDEEPSNERLSQFINEEIDRRRRAVIELMRQNNLLLDNVGHHGVQPVPDRAAFFAKLYTKEHLAEMKFPFVEQVLDLLKSPKYDQLELRFLPRDPTEPATSP